jgi:Cu/Ag efflux protein CusF
VGGGDYRRMNVGVGSGPLRPSGINLTAPAHQIAIAHGPIRAIGWPGMTMTFNAKSAPNLGSIKVGQKIGFVVNTKGGAPQVSQIVPRK